MITDKVSSCAFESSYSTKNTTVTYDQLTVETNTFSPGGLNKTTGIFTSRVSGLVSVSVYFSPYSIDGKTTTATRVYIQKNGGKLDEGIIATTKSTTLSYIDESAGKNLLLLLNKTDTVSVFMASGYQLYSLTFCVHSI
eukprot:GFUD01002234.1.p1 GENE.GFUD01002234.1~~GFUD01002234.1.p1  ORF type:complete len:139 (-),score=30.91 GFUD01002234.1:11-427(-)